MSKSKSRIGITTGDPKGIGPEIVATALTDPEIQALAEFSVFGTLAPKPNLPDVEASQAALHALKEATEAALQKKVDCLVTGPVNKARLRTVQKNFVGHTEWLSQFCQSEAQAFFVAGNWRVALVTRHLPLAEVATKLNGIDILKTIRLTHQALQKYFGILEPHLAVCGLNPHAGESGHLGEEERKIIRPAIHQACKEGIRAEGPFPADTLFWQMTQGKFDAVVAMYHDQGLIPLKTLAFKECVQLTLGLPFLRVSVDHGTAEDLVGSAQADSANMKAAIRWAVRLIL